MDTHELRIGNYVEVNSIVAKIITISTCNNTIEVILPSKEVVAMNPDRATPIVLESELLTNNCVFDGMGKYQIGIDPHLYFLKFHNGYIMLSNREGEPVIHFWDVRHLHQLQNLYYALKGKEIEINFDGRKS